jgi:excisionase family DNA binding protein
MTAAARLRGVSRPAIADLVRRGRLHSYRIGERQLVNKSEILAFKPQPIGRPPKKEIKKKV